MKLRDLDEAALRERLHGSGLGLRIGPFAVRLSSRIPAVARSMARLYGDYPLLDTETFFDFHVAVERPPGVRRWIAPQALFLEDGIPPFRPLPISQAYPFFEWGLNWCIAQYAHQFLILHAAVVERDGMAVILPGNPGAGKSTLCASLVTSGWRLLSDEMALIPAGGETLVPIPRPVALKNASIDLLKGFAPHTVFGESFHDTAKGTIAHMQAGSDAVQGMARPARPRLLVFPRFEANVEPSLSRLEPAQAFLKAVECAFNYDFLGTEGFERLRRVVTACDCYDFRYGSLEGGLSGIRELWQTLDGEGQEANHG